MCLAQGPQRAVTPMRLEPAAPGLESSTLPLIHCAPYNNSKLRLHIMYKYVILTLLNDVITFLTSLKCNFNVTQVIYTVFFQFQF